MFMCASWKISAEYRDLRMLFAEEFATSWWALRTIEMWLHFPTYTSATLLFDFSSVSLLQRQDRFNPIVYDLYNGQDHSLVEYH